MASTEYLSVGGGTMEAYVDAPAGAGPHPAMVVTHHRGGLDAFTRMFVEDLAAAGYVAAALAFYHRRPAGEEATESMAALDDAEMIADVVERDLPYYDAAYGDVVATRFAGLWSA